MPKADWSCDECGEILPADRFLKTIDRELVRSSSSTRLYKGTRGGLGFGGGTSSSYRHVPKKLCPDCVENRLVAARRARSRRRLGWLVSLAIAVVAVIWIGRLPPAAPSSEQTAPVPQAPVTTANPEPEPPAPGSADIAPDAVQPPTALPDATGGEAQYEGGASPDDPSDTAIAPSDTDDTAMTAAIAAATPTALDSGQPASWKAGGRHGYVVVSAAQDQRGRRCRNAYWTLITDNNQIQGPSKLWCKDDGEEWTER